jgi:hypothetical protein
VDAQDGATLTPEVAAAYARAALERGRPFYRCACKTCSCELHAYGPQQACIWCRHDDHQLGRRNETRVDAIRRRTPIVTVELQLWPPPPPTASPWWWGHHMLSFYDEERKEVWRRQFVHEAGKLDLPMSVRRTHASGWVLVLELTHDRARRALHALEFRPEPGEEEQSRP